MFRLKLGAVNIRAQYLFLALVLLCSTFNLAYSAQKALALASTITRVSTDSSGTESDGASYGAVSNDGNFALFSSDATNLVGSDTNGTTDVFVKDLTSGTTTRVSTDSSGTESDGSSDITSISNDNRYVVFQSDATNLVASDTNGFTDIFMKDRQTGTTTRVSTDSSGTESDGMSQYAMLSGNGRYVAFYSTATNLVASDTNGAVDVFLKDTQTGTTTRVSTDSSGNEIAEDSFTGSGMLPDNGRYVVFGSDSPSLVAGDTNGVDDVFIKDTQTGTTTRVSTDSSGNEASAGALFGAISATGRYIGFESSSSDLVASDTNGVADAFMKDTQTGVTIRVSTDSSGNEVDDYSYTPIISSDGRYAAFTSNATNVVAGDTNAALDGFVKDLVSGIVSRVSTDSSGGQASNGGSAWLMSANGQYVSVGSDSSDLVTGDTNGFSDLFIKDITLITGGPGLSGRSLTISSSIQSATNVNYTIRFVMPSVDTLQSIRLRFCTTPLASATCTQPTGIDVGGYSVASQNFSQGTVFTSQTSNENNCSVATGGNNEFEICLQRTDTNNELADQKTIVLSGIDNPSVLGTIFVRITLYSDSSFDTGGRLFEGAVATSINAILTISAKVQEILSFCIANTSVNDDTTFIGADCSSITGTTGSVVDMGVVDYVPGSTVSPDVDGNNLTGVLMIRTNAVNGATIGYRAVQQSGTNYVGSLRVSGSTCSGASNTVGSPNSSSDRCFNANTAKTALSTSLEQFGVTGRYINRTSSEGSTTSVSLAADYDSTLVVGYAWQEDGSFAELASSTGSTDKVIDDEAVILSFGAVSALTTPTGTYSAQADFIAVSVF